MSNPSRASRRAIPRPMPSAAPVMIATRLGVGVGVGAPAADGPGESEVVMVGGASCFEVRPASVVGGFDYQREEESAKRAEIAA